MKTILIQVGKTVNKHFIAGINDYVERIGHYMPFEVVTIPELKNTKNLTEEQQKQAEGELILKQLQPTDTVVLLDEHGKEYRSIEFARWLEQKQQTARRLIFIIGGPYGFSPVVYQRANEQLSLSKMTFSHQMIRLTFTEQIYRACTMHLPSAFPLHTAGNTQRGCHSSQHCHDDLYHRLPKFLVFHSFIFHFSSLKLPSQPGGAGGGC